MSKNTKRFSNKKYNQLKRLSNVEYPSRRKKQSNHVTTPPLSHQGSSKSSGTIPAYRKDQGSLAAPPKSPPPRSSKGGGRYTAPSPSQHDVVDSQQSSDSSSRHRPLPNWATLEPDCRVWKDTLDDLGVDVMAQKEVFLLGQLDPEAGNTAIAKLLKRVCDGEDIRNPSAFVHTVVKDLRHQHQNKKHGW